MTYSSTTFEVATSNVLGDVFYKKKNSLIFDLDLGHTKSCQYHLHHVTYSGTKFEVATSKRCIYKKIHYLALDLRSHEILPSTLYHVTYQGTKFEVAMSNGLGRDTFTRNVTGRRTRLQMHLCRVLPMLEQEMSQKRDEYPHRNKSVIRHILVKLFVI